MEKMTALEKLRSDINPYQQALLTHPINSYITSQDHLRIFMQHHVFAVWDFMSLVKRLQQDFTCVTLPWVPKGSAEVRYLINEIVLGEESDVDQHGQYTSHFELYIRAMKELGIIPFDSLKVLTAHTNIDSLLAELSKLDLPTSIESFLRFTFESVQQRPIEEIAAIFTFGREDLIPGMFQLIVDQLRISQPEESGTLLYYLERHIEVDGGHHSALAFQMMEELCGDDVDKWSRATQVAIRSLEIRKELWDGIISA